MKSTTPTVYRHLTADQRAALAPYFSSIDGRVTALRNMPPVVAGALFSRLSRSTKDVVQLFQEEFLLNPDLALHSCDRDLPSTVDVQRAEAFYDRLILGYGDDSCAELVGAHIAMTGLSVVAIKQIESTRIGLSYLETSSRYRMFDRRIDGRWPYVRPAEFGGAAIRVYERIMDRLFATYSALIEPLTADLMKLYPAAEGLSDKAHVAAIRAKAADVLRALLPIGHTSSLGIYGNGRAFEYLLLKMASSELAEVRDLERELYDALMQVIPNFVKRAHTDRGVAHSGYLSGVRRDVRQRARLAGLQPLGSLQHGVVFVHSDPDAENKVAAGVLYGDCQRPLAELEAYVRRLPMESRNAILRDGVSGRANRYQRVPRAFERAEYDLEITANWGVFKDLARHRMETPFTSLLTPLHGYQIPDELVGTHYEGIVSGALDEVTPAWMVLNEVAPVAAQYCVPMAMKFRYSVHTNLRQLSHLVELRSTIQGHRDYRAIAHDITRQLRAVHPTIGALATEFVDFSEVDLPRLQSELRAEQKRRLIATDSAA